MTAARAQRRSRVGVDGRGGRAFVGSVPDLPKPDLTHPVADPDGPCDFCGHQARYVNCIDGSMSRAKGADIRVFGKHTIAGNNTATRALDRTPLCPGSGVAVDPALRPRQADYYAR